MYILTEPYRWSKNQLDSAFLQLPGEMRIMIYEFALGGHTIEIFFRSYTKKEHEDGRVDRVPHFKYGSIVHSEIRDRSEKNSLSGIHRARGMSLLNGVCRQLYLETSTLPYKLNDIWFRANNTMFNFIVMERRLRSAQLGAITELTVHHDLPGQSVLALMPNLKRVHLISESALTFRKAHEWSPPSVGSYRVVEGRKGRELERERVRTTYGQGYGRY